MAAQILMALKNGGVDYSRPVKLYDDPDHQIYSVGTHTGGEEIECNTYLIVDGEEGYLIEPGGHDRYFPVLEKVTQVIKPTKVSHVLVSHQDPDLCASIPQWMRTNRSLKVVLPAQWVRFMPHYMDYELSQLMSDSGSYLPVTDEGARIPLKSGGQIRCIPAPYLHSPGNMAIYDTVSGFLFSGDIGAAIYRDGVPRLVIDDWQAHTLAMQGFHQRYMSSNKAVSVFVRKMDGLQLQAILPQHGSIFRGAETSRFLQWLEKLPVGVDYLYGAAQV